MANTNSTQYAKIVNKRTSGAHAPLETQEQAGKVRYAFATATTVTGNIAQNDTYTMFELPPNCRVIEVTLSYAGASSALGPSGATVDVYLDAYTAQDSTGAQTSIALSNFLTTVAVNANDKHYSYQGDGYAGGHPVNNATEPVKVILKASNAAGLTAGKPFTVAATYVVE